jgi:hypothetical protein
MALSHQAVGEQEPPTAPTKPKREPKPPKEPWVPPPPKTTVPLPPVPSFGELVEDRRSPHALDASEESEAQMAELVRAATTVNPHELGAPELLELTPRPGVGGQGPRRSRA